MAMNARVKATPPAPVTIKPRRMDFHFDDSIPVMWFDNDVFKTLLLTGLSSTFPEGERFFIRAVREYQDQITDPVLRQQVRGFIGQEGHHGKEHDALNDFMQRKGLPVKAEEEFVHNGIALQEKYLSRERRLAKTCALEHFTALFAELLLEHPDFFKGMDERVFPIWLWHAVEESEHKTVAFDVYQQTVGSYWIRTSEMAKTTIEFSFFTALHMYRLSRSVEGGIGFRNTLKGLNFLFGKKGWLRTLAPCYRAYYRRDFHPAEVDSTELRVNAMKQLAKILNKPELAEDYV
jgi:predicted metal-dependent hydrolase